MEFYDFVSEIYPCSYLENENSQFKYMCIKDCTPHFYNGLLERGYRRFGELFFVPKCPGCSKCITIRQLVAEFSFSKNMKRNLKNNIDTIVRIRRPALDNSRLQLYMRYHKKMNVKKKWAINEIDRNKYVDSFIVGSNIFGYEMTFYRDYKLIGVSYFDIVEHAMSAIYFFYDHDYEKLSLGNLNILMLLQLCKKLKLKYFYPGYWIENHKSMGYKYRFRPFEALINNADIFDATKWKRYN